MNSNNISLLNNIQNIQSTNTINATSTVCERAPFDLAENCDPVDVDIQFEIDCLCSLPELPDTEAFPRTTPFNLDVPFVDAPNCIDIQGEGFKFGSKEDDCAIGIYTLELSCPIDVYGESEIEITQNDAEEPTGKATIKIDCDTVDLDIDLNIPCPISVFVEADTEVKSEGTPEERSPKLSASLDINCDGADFDIDLDIPCPIDVSKEKSFEVPQAGTKGSGKISLDIDCEKADISLALSMPCPINVSGDITVDITQNDAKKPTGSGTFNIECETATLDIDLNIPCPINVSKKTPVEITTNGTPGSKPTGSAKLDVSCGDATLDIDLDIPCPINVVIGSGVVNNGGQGDNKESEEESDEGDAPISAQAAATSANTIAITGTIKTKFGEPKDVSINGTGNINGRITCDSASLNAMVELDDITIPIPIPSIPLCSDISISQNFDQAKPESGKLVDGHLTLNIPCSGPATALITASVECESKISGAYTKSESASEASVKALGDTSSEESSSTSGTDTVKVDVLGTVGVTYNECEGTLKVTHDLYANVPKSEGYECSGSSINGKSATINNNMHSSSGSGISGSPVKLNLSYSIDSCDPASLSITGGLDTYINYWDSNGSGSNVGTGIVGDISVEYKTGNPMTVAPALSIQPGYISSIVKKQFPDVTVAGGGVYYENDQGGLGDQIGYVKVQNNIIEVLIDPDDLKQTIITIIKEAPSGDGSGKINWCEKTKACWPLIPCSCGVHDFAGT